MRTMSMLVNDDGHGGCEQSKNHPASKVEQHPACREKDAAGSEPERAYGEVSACGPWHTWPCWQPAAMR